MNFDSRSAFEGGQDSCAENQFPATAPAANAVFYRTYSRPTGNPDKPRESWLDMCKRTTEGLVKLGKLTEEEAALIYKMQVEKKTLCSGRFQWVGGTTYSEHPENIPSLYNCSSTDITDWRAFGLLMDLAMMGCGTGAVLEKHYIEQLPVIRNTLDVEIVGAPGDKRKGDRQEHTTIEGSVDKVVITVGDSRQGWVDSYQSLLEMSSSEAHATQISVVVDLSNIRPKGEKLKGFGGVANPIKLPDLYGKCANVLNEAVGRKLNALECCLLIDEAALVVVAGNVRRSAGMRQFSQDDQSALTAKDDLWQQNDDGEWVIDAKRDALRMANHTRVFHEKPSLEECINSVRKQYYSGEGAIQWAGEAKVRAKGDSRYGLNPCGEILLQNNFCNLSEVHLNQLDPGNKNEQRKAFEAGAISVASLLHHRFIEPRYQKSREEDPIVGVSFTGLFDFFVKAFGVKWLEWWAEGRPATAKGAYFKQLEKNYLIDWEETVRHTVWDYCDRHNLNRPNRCTTVQPAGSKSLLTGASSGWAPPKAQRFIRRVTFGKNDPVALACLDYGYKVVPAQSDTDEEGRLLNDSFDPRCTEWLVEIPTEVAWANLPGADEIDISQFSALAQFDFYMQVQRYYTTHNTSATLEMREHEIEDFGTRIFQAIRDDEGYISAALLARFDDYQSFPRLPFEPIDKETYDRLQAEVLSRRKVSTFAEAIASHDQGEREEPGPAACDSDKCMMPERK